MTFDTEIAKLVFSSGRKNSVSLFIYNHSWYELANSKVQSRLGEKIATEAASETNAAALQLENSHYGVAQSHVMMENDCFSRCQKLYLAVMQRLLNEITGLFSCLGLNTISDHPPFPGLLYRKF